MFDIGEKDKGISYINKALDLYPKNNTRTFVSFMLDTMKVLLKMMYYIGLKKFQTKY